MFEKKESYRTAPQKWLIKICDPFKQGIVDSITFKQTTYSTESAFNKQDYIIELHYHEQHIL